MKLKVQLQTYQFYQKLLSILYFLLKLCNYSSVVVKHLVALVLVLVLFLFWLKGFVGFGLVYFLSVKFCSAPTLTQTKRTRAMAKKNQFHILPIIQCRIIFFLLAEMTYSPLKIKLDC